MSLFSYCVLTIRTICRSARPVDAIYSIVREMSDPDEVRYVIAHSHTHSLESNLPIASFTLTLLYSHFRRIFILGASYWCVISHVGTLSSVKRMFCCSDQLTLLGVCRV